MRLDELILDNFRSHTKYEVEFDSGINLITGPNGCGKTNLLEGIHYLCLTKNFASARDSAAIQSGTDHFILSGKFTDERKEKEYSVLLRYSRSEGKQLSVNRVQPERLADHVGRFPVVVFSPDDYALTAAGPEERRRFLDNMLCQAYGSYMANLLSYRHALRQRNSLLQSGYGSPGFSGQLEAWTIEVVKYGAKVIHRRVHDISLIHKYLHISFSLLEIDGEIPELRYRHTLRDSSLPGLAEEGLTVPLVEIEEKYFEKMVESRDTDMARKRTTIGPHRDELELFVNDRPLRNFASQGQHRTFAMALKFAQYHYLYSQVDERPIVLLDDAFDHLDPERIASYVRLVSDNLECQTFITTANPGVLDSLISYDSKNKRFDLSGRTMIATGSEVVN